MERLSILDTVWYNSDDTHVTFKRLVVLVSASASTTSAPDAAGYIDDDVVSMLDNLRRAVPITLPF